MREPRHPIPLKPPLSTRVGYVHDTQRQIQFAILRSFNRFVFIARQHTDAILIQQICLQVCLSVRYAPVPDENGLTYRHSFFHHTVAQSLQFYHHQTFSQNSDEWGIKISRFSMNKWLHLANDTRYRHITMEGEQELVCDLSNGGISNDLERNLTLFSRSHHSDAKYLTNGYRYGHRTRAFEWHQFQ